MYNFLFKHKSRLKNSLLKIKFGDFYNFFTSNRLKRRKSRKYLDKKLF